MNSHRPESAWGATAAVPQQRVKATLLKVALPFALLAMASGCGQSASTTNAVTDCPTKPATYSPPSTSSGVALTSFSLEEAQSETPPATPAATEPRTGCPNDFDCDGVPTNMDANDNNAQVTATKTDPDTDGDGVPDSKDQDPNDANNANVKSGLTQFFDNLNGMECNAQCQAGKSGGHGATHGAADLAETPQGQQEARRDGMAETQAAANNLSPCDAPDLFAGTTLNANNQNGQQIGRSPTTDASKGGSPEPNAAAGVTQQEIGDKVVERADKTSEERLEDGQGILDKIGDSTPATQSDTKATDSGMTCGLSSGSGSQISGTGVSCDTKEGRGNTSIGTMGLTAP